MLAPELPNWLTAPQRTLLPLYTMESLHSLPLRCCNFAGPPGKAFPMVEEGEKGMLSSWPGR